MNTPFTPPLPPAPRRTLFARIRASFLTGLVVIAPVGLTIWLIWTVIGWIDGIVLPMVPLAYHPDRLIQTYFGLDPSAQINVRGIGVIIFLLFTIVVGWLAKGLLGRSLIRIAENMGSNSCLVMRNHGFLTVGKTAGECFMNMYYLIRLCEVALSAKASSLPMDPGAPDLWSLASKQYEAFSPGKYEWPALKRKCDRLDPSYKF